MNPFGHHHQHHEPAPAAYVPGQHHGPAPAAYVPGQHHEPGVPGQIVKIYCEANPDFLLSHINGSVAMAVANEADPNQQWVMDTAWGVKLKDEAGFPSFSLINKATGQALRHGRAENEKLILGPYHADDLNEAVLFTQSADVGKGYQCIRPVNNINVNVDAAPSDPKDKKHVATVHEGSPVALTKWNKKESQKWKITPILSATQGVGSRSSFYPQVTPVAEGPVVRIHCEANPDFFLAPRGALAVLTVANPSDPHQQWIKVDSWGLKRKDEAGYPSFALVNKATGQALKHGAKEWDQVHVTEYRHEKQDDGILWTLSADVGNGFQCLRPVNNIHLNMDAKMADNHKGGIHEGNELILFDWKKQSNQKWKLVPIY